jgi:transcriptional regulator GlxA family with amidase domain
MTKIDRRAVALLTLTAPLFVSGAFAEPGGSVNERVVRDRNRVTRAGVTSGLDFGLAMVAELRDRTYAECCQLMSEYDPQRPSTQDDWKGPRKELAGLWKRSSRIFARRPKPWPHGVTGWS